jgi:hypothetical protein
MQDKGSATYSPHTHTTYFVYLNWIETLTPNARYCQQKKKPNPFTESLKQNGSVCFPERKWVSA